MHVLRGDETGVVAQVLAHSLDTVKGISRDVSPDTQNLCNKFWPGLLSVTLRPSSVLNWDLGDDKALDWFNVRVPKSKFVRALLKESCLLQSQVLHMQEKHRCSRLIAPR
jgi:tRNA A37 threonylcarbamoyladenosine synthetase subunit TsaC/SUA5/YrdC